MCRDALFQTGKLSPNTTRVRTELLCAFVCGPVYVPLCSALCTCLCVQPCVRSFVCGPVYVPLCAALCTSFTATNRARRQVETKLASLVLITIQVNHYFVCAPEMFCIDFVSASSYDANERACNVDNYICEKLTFMESPSV